MAAKRKKKKPVAFSAAQAKKAADLYSRFSGHKARAKVIEDGKKKGTMVATKFGKLDFFELNVGGKNIVMQFKGAKRPDLAASYDGKKLLVFGKVPMKSADGTALPSSLGTVRAIGYTTRRDGRRVSYVHDFKPSSRPRLKRSGSKLLLVGGRYAFKETGINDK